MTTFLDNADFIEKYDLNSGVIEVIEEGRFQEFTSRIFRCGEKTLREFNYKNGASMIMARSAYMD